MYLTDLDVVLRRAPGLVVVEHPGWESRGRGAMRSVDGVVCHHTAGPKTGDHPSLNAVVNGRPGLSGPLSNLFLSRSGVVTIVAAGKANHAGQVRSATFENGRRIGIEAEAAGVDGVPADWPAVQVAAYAKVCAALCLGYHFNPADVLGHKEVCFPDGRKIDPNFGMPAFRTMVGRELDIMTSASRGNPRPTVPVVVPAGSLPVLQFGNTRPSSHVKAVQQRLAVLGWNPGPDDGLLGARTEAAVIGLQVAAGLVADGVVGPRTRGALDGGQRPRIVLSRVIGRPDTGDVVRAVQRELLRVGAKLPEFGADGVAGAEFAAAVRWVQGRAGEDRDGFVGEHTVPWLGGAWTGKRG